ncbi:patatin-like phospholipase family protein [Abyssalbus ytuae]|uniref:Patatin-like phospholipase family protein n=1 Tax=Abyssalbus ytuae TaxID=2926907 RepID=A0A9E7CU32_9FLAO|nr:patatin-like phospholipase family protein [Abyssalbus ytuae]UOB19316.1 patatin-like phospholipase family protein [Abyssalbus ytuae]
MENKKFKLCITMAGAVSAGAYTGGVLDYLLETLHLWEKAKVRNRELGENHPDYDHSIPMHDIEIDVISGASAGGITGTISLLSVLDENYQYANESNPEGKNNLFYQSWVEMADDEKSNTLTKLLSTDDLEKVKKPEALLNTSAIEMIANKALTINKAVKYPPYVSKNLDLILTTTNLRGINFKIDFSGINDDSSSVITSHGGFLRYKVKNELHDRGIPDDNKSLYYVLDLNEEQDIEYLRDATLSTAAFPIGLKPREIVISKKYIQRYPKYLFGRRKGISPIINDNEEAYKFNSIDGGLINNEPFGIGLKILKEKNPGILKKDNYAVIMVDPFPNQDNTTLEPHNGRNIIDVAKGMFKALRNQVMFNQDGILDALSLSDRTKFLIAPSRKQNINGVWRRSKNHLASYPISGFAGFLDKSFRKHDFELGRKNCQAFLRYYFSVEKENIEKRLGEQVSKEALERFSYAYPPRDVNGKYYFPIIPDMKVKTAFDTSFLTDKYGNEADIPYPEYPSFSLQNFDREYKSILRKRVRGIVKKLADNWFLYTGFKFLFQNKTYNYIKNTIAKELFDADLLKNN